MEKRTIRIIVNPIAGVRPKSEIPTLVKHVFMSDKFEVDYCETRYAGHATELASEAAKQGFDTVLAIGGDGTVNETARGLVGTKTAIGIVPMGSGNGLARHLQLPLESEHAMQVVVENHRQAIDYGKANEHIFFCTAGVGFDADISQKFAQAGQRGAFTYVREVIDHLRKYDAKTYSIYTDDEKIRERAFLICVGNASQWGNDAKITPEATMDDGLMDITLIKPFPPAGIPQLVTQLFNGTIHKNPNVLYFRSSHVRIVLPKETPVHVDGEPFEMKGVVDIQTIPAGLHVLTPANPVTQRLNNLRYGFEEVHYSILANLKKSIPNMPDIPPITKLLKTK